MGLLDFILEEAASRTGSRLGRLYWYDVRRGAYGIRFRGGLEGRPVESLEDAGIWGEAARRGTPFIDNDIRGDGTREPKERLLAVPIPEDGAPAALICVADKASDYGQEDLRIVGRLAAWAFQAGDGKRESMGRLAGSVAHDFNNLLVPILGYADLLLKDTPSGAYGHEELLQIVQAAELGKDLARRLLEFGRKKAAAMNPMDLAGALRAFRGLLRRSVRGDVRLHFQIPEAPLPVCADRGQIELAVMNLVLNAQDAMPTGGDLTVCLSAADAGPQDPPGTGRVALLAVSDTGSGMGREVLARLSEPFFTTKEKGTGLGLATVYGTVRRHGGRVLVDSEVGRGSVFTIRLPLMRESAVPPRVTGPETGLPWTGKTVLVVEDDECVRDLTCRMLERLGCGTFRASDAVGAMAVMEEHGYAVGAVITDLVIPDMNGRELARRLAAARPGLRILTMSGYAESVEDGAQDGGSAGFIQKPFTMETLSEELRKLWS